MFDIKVLIVDDILYARSLYKETLGVLPIHIFEAQNGFEFLHLLFLERPDIVLVDINLPDISGIDLVKTIRQSDLTTEVIVITAQKDTNTVETLAKYKIHSYLVKPIDVDNLLSKVKQIIQNKGIDIDIDSNSYDVNKVQNDDLKKKVLIVEDRANTRLFLQEIVEGEGHKSFSAITGEDAWQKILNEELDLIILDIGLPDISGFEVVDRMRKQDLDIPIIVVTGREEDEIKEQIANYQINNVLQKPLNMSEIHSVLKLYLNDDTGKKVLDSEVEEDSEISIENKNDKQIKYFYTMMDLIKDLWEKIGDPKDYYKFLSQAKSNNYNYNFLFETLTFLVGRLGHKAFNVLSYALTCGNNNVRESVCDVLGDIGKKNVLGFLTDALSDENHVVRIGAMESLAKIGKKEAIKSIKICLGDDLHIVRIKAAQIFLNNKMYEFLFDIIVNLAGDDNNLDKSIIKIISRMKIDEVLNSFEQFASSSVIKVREFFLDILSNQKAINEKALNSIIKLLDDKEESVQLAAIDALVKHGGASIEVYLMNKLSSGSSMIRRYVAKQLKVISEKQYHLEGISEVKSGKEEALIDTFVTIIKAEDQKSLEGIYNFLKNICGDFEAEEIFNAFIKGEYEPLGKLIAVLFKGKFTKNVKIKIYELLKSENNHILSLGLLLLKYARNLNDVEIFKKYINSDDYKIRILVYDGILFVAKDVELNFVLNKLKEEKENVVLYSILPLMLNYKSDEIINFLLYFITYPDDIVIVIVIEVLGGFQDKRLLPILNELKLVKQGKYERDINIAINKILY